MDMHLLTEPQPPHQHEAARRRDHAFPVMLVVAFLVQSACAAFAVIMTNGPDGRAAAEQIPVPTISGAAGLAVDTSADKTVEPLDFGVAMPGGPVVIGQPGHIVVTIANPHAHAVELDALDVEVSAPEVSGCRAEWLAIESYRPDGAPITVPARGTANISLHYELRDLPGVNQDACKGAEFPLTINGSGRPV